MKEKLKHIEAFELFYSLGGKASDKSCSKVAVKLQVSERTIWNWYKKFNWRERVDQRNIENAKSLGKKTDRAVVNTKADYRAEIKTQLSILKAMLNNVIKEIKAHNIIDINNTGQLKDVVNCYEKLGKLDLLMMGEATDEKDINIKVELTE